LTSGAVWKVILRFAFPLLIGNLLQQLYNVTDSVIVGQFLGKESLAAVSASFFIYYFIISPAPRNAPLKTFKPPCTIKNPPMINKYSLPIRITSGSLVKASIILSPKK
jgi:hypothetical protein